MSSCISSPGNATGLQEQISSFFPDYLAGLKRGDDVLWILKSMASDRDLATFINTPLDEDGSIPMHLLSHYISKPHSCFEDDKLREIATTFIDAGGDPCNSYFHSVAYMAWVDLQSG